MIGVRETVSVAVVLLLLSIGVLAGNDINEEIYERQYNPPLNYDNRVQALIESKRSITAIKKMVDQLETNFGKRVCELGGGMSAACNNKDLLDAMDHHRYLLSSYAPGRRRRSSPTNLDTN